MAALRLLLVIMFLVLAVYTGFVIAEHGLVLFPYFFGDVGRADWSGQFNLDFLMMLMLSALWVSWRHRFSGVGLALGVVAFFGGMGFLSVYLFVQSFLTKGNVVEILIGDR